jgi:hypothetical protein
VAADPDGSASGWGTVVAVAAGGGAAVCVEDGVAVALPPELAVVVEVVAGLEAGACDWDWAGGVVTCVVAAAADDAAEAADDAVVVT